MVHVSVWRDENLPENGFIFRFLNRVYIKTSQPKRRAQSVPARRVAEMSSSDGQLTGSAKSRGRLRCPTCSGRPIFPALVSCVFTYRNQHTLHKLCTIIASIQNEFFKKCAMNWMFILIYFSQIFKINFQMNSLKFVLSQTIPEERIPFEPPRKSCNYKLVNDKSRVHRCCKFCCWNKERSFMHAFQSGTFSVLSYDCRTRMKTINIHNLTLALPSCTIHSHCLEYMKHLHHLSRAQINLFKLILTSPFVILPVKAYLFAFDNCLVL